MRKRIHCLRGTAQIALFSMIIFVTNAQPTATKKDCRDGLLSIAYYIESANNSINSLNGLLRKDNYRNKITALNNPANSDLGFNLKIEILSALKPLLVKAKKTDHRKFNEVIDGLLNTTGDDGVNAIQKIFPASSIFSTILSLVGNLVITEKGITKADLDAFTQRMQQFLAQYEKLNEINDQFSMQTERLLQKTDELKEDLKEFLLDCITTMNRNYTKESLKEKSVEGLIQKFYDPQKIQSWLDTTEFDGFIYPADAATSVKFLTSSIKKLQREFGNVYEDNYKQLKELMTSLKTNIINLDQKQLEKTNAEIERLYNDSRQADIINMNLAQVDERMNTVCKIINMGR